MAATTMQVLWWALILTPLWIYIQNLFNMPIVLTMYMHNLASFPELQRALLYGMDIYNHIPYILITHIFALLRMSILSIQYA